MRTYLLLVSFLTVLGLEAQNFQEKIIENTQSNTCVGAISLGDNLYFNYSSADYFMGYHKNAVLFKADNDLHIIDSLDLSYVQGCDWFHFMNIIPYSDTSFMVLGVGYKQNPYSENMILLIIDESLNTVKTFSGGDRVSSFVGAATACRADSVLVAAGYKKRVNGSFMPAYFVFNNNGTLIKEVTIDSIMAGVNAIRYQNGYLYAGFRPATHANLLKIETDSFSIDTMVSGLFGVKKALAYSGFFNLSGGGHEFYGYGQLSWNRLALVKIDTALNVTKIDSFASVQNPIFPEHSTVADIGVLSVGDEESIFFATGEGSYFVASQLDSGLITNMKLWRVDTGGNVIWSVLVNDSSYYFPMKTVATSDGGAVFFSMKYDWRKDPSPKTALSIIKLNSNGNFIALHEKEVGYSKPLEFSVYPNPVVNELTLSGVELRDVAAVLVYSMDGVLIEEEVNPQSLTISLADVPNGTYVVHVLHKNGSQGMQKVLKRN